MLVSSVILSGMLLSGFTNSLNLSTIFPFSIFTAPISIILSFLLEKPVVSKSKTTKVSSIVLSPALDTIGTPSSTR